MAFDAQQKKINDILSGDFKYVIPRYQRKYVWQEKQWRELLDDIKYCLSITIIIQRLFSPVKLTANRGEYIQCAFIRTLSGDNAVINEH